jgi:hypothetical protein
MKYRLSLVAWLAFLLLGGATGAGANTVPTEAGPMPFIGNATYGLTRLAQAAPAAAPADAQPADDEPIGNVATLTGTATVTRNNTPTPLKLQDDIFLNDVLQTSANSTLGVTFNDATTFNLTANARIAIDNYVYEDGGKQNSALFDIAKGTVAFVAAEVAHSGDIRYRHRPLRSGFVAPPALSRCRRVPLPIIRTTSRSSSIPTPMAGLDGSR